ncbi:hypothetical protein DM01DRAFT_1330874 [Hesseltinella vesiculosa]|uniref:Uncharacterized protein n=1 Tax=Hesseltinella vesiculosa TaxID=101127 RepID=A0A1X2GXD0_9FUNG|nr:hypothetical protein DM01DRAFT_1330874 [Hesseltinella vesiculosa]
MTSQGSGSTNVLINATADTSANNNDLNYHVTMNATARSDQFMTFDMAYYDSSDFATNPADFVYRLTFAHVLEFDDLNNNGLYDAQEPVLSITSLQNAPWQPLNLNNRTVPNNNTQTFLETITAANVTYNNTSPGLVNGTSFSISVTMRSSNLQLNGTAPITIQPNSLQYDVILQNFPAVAPPTAQNPRVALAQVVTSFLYSGISLDINSSTAPQDAQLIKSNLTYGLSVGNYSEGRLEYQSSVNITSLIGVGTNTWTGLLDPSQVNRLTDPNAWAWGAGVTPDQRNSSMILVTMNNANGGYQLSGLAFLDSDVINAAINAAPSLSKLSRTSMALFSSLALMYLVL